MSELDREVQMGLARAREEIRAAAGAALAECVEAIAQQARADCPVRSGRLRDSISQEVAANLGGEVIEARVRARAPYAAAVELGLGTSPPQPFLFPALERRGARLAQVVRRKLGR